MAKITDDLMRRCRRECYSLWEILSLLVQSGMEFPDAQWRMTRVFKLDAEEVEQMVRDYDEIC